MAVYLQLVGIDARTQKSATSSCALVRFCGMVEEEVLPECDRLRACGIINPQTLHQHSVVLVNLTSRDLVIESAPYSFTQFNWMANDAASRASVYKRGKIGDQYVVESAPSDLSWRQRMAKLPSIRHTVHTHFAQLALSEPFIVFLVCYPPIAELRDLLLDPQSAPATYPNSSATFETFICMHNTESFPSNSHQCDYDAFEQSILWPQLEFDDKERHPLDAWDPIFKMTPGLRHVRGFLHRPQQNDHPLTIHSFSSMHFFDSLSGGHSLVHMVDGVLKYLFGEVRLSKTSTTRRVSVPLPSGWGSRLRPFTDTSFEWLNSQHHSLNCANPGLGSTTFNVTVMDKRKSWSVFLLLELTHPTSEGASIDPSSPTLVVCREGTPHAHPSLKTLNEEINHIESVSQPLRDAFVTNLVRADRTAVELRDWIASWSITDALGVQGLFALMRTVAGTLLNDQTKAIETTKRLLDQKNPLMDDLAHGDDHASRTLLPLLPTRAVSQFTRLHSEK